MAGLWRGLHAKMSSVSLGRSRNSDIAARTPQCDGPAFGASSASTYSSGDAIAEVGWNGASPPSCADVGAARRRKCEV